MQTELLEKEREIEQLKYKLRSKQDELDRLNKERTEEVLILTQEIDSLKYCKSAALNSYDERMDLLHQIELLKKVVILYFYLIRLLQYSDPKNACIIVQGFYQAISVPNVFA